MPSEPNQRQEPFPVPPSYPEISTSSVLFGVISGIILNASMTYAGLKIGYTIPASTVAAILGFGVLRGILRRGSILEVNIAQSVASSVQLPCSGVIFTVPVLILLGIPLDPTTSTFWWIALGTTAGAVLGSAFIIPVRKQMVEIDRLRFPSGVAVAVILKSPGAGNTKSLLLLAGSILAAAIYLPTQLGMLSKLDYFNRWEPLKNINYGLAEFAYGSGEQTANRILGEDTIDLGKYFNIPACVVVVFAIAPLSFGAGYLSGKPGLVVLAGGVLAYWLLNPLAYASGMFPGVDVGDVPNLAKNAFNRPLGIGMLLGGALMGLVTALPAMKEAIAGLRRSRQTAPTQELGMGVLLTSVIVSFVGLFLAAAATRDPSLASTGWLAGLPFHVQNLVVALVGGIWMWFGGIVISQCAGMTDWSPISGMALVTVILVMFLCGTSDVIASVVVGAALCVSVTCASDMMQDLKTGQLLGARPAVQQVSQLFTSALGPIVSLGTILILVAGQNRLNASKLETAGPAAPQATSVASSQPASDQNRLPIGPDTKFEAQQAQALAAVIKGVQGGDMPYAIYGCGAISGIALGLTGFPGLGVLVGLSMYLPISYVLTYGLGCLANMLVTSIKGADWAEEWGVPLASGLIVGESLVGILFSLLAVVG